MATIKYKTNGPIQGSASTPSLRGATRRRNPKYKHNNQQGFILISTLLIILLISSVLAFLSQELLEQKTLSAQIQHHIQQLNTTKTA